MKCSFVCDAHVVLDAATRIASEYQVYADWMELDADQFGAIYAWSDDLAQVPVSHWGINSSWRVETEGLEPGKVRITLGGRRCSLRDWCPKEYLEEADRQWEAGTLEEYDSWRLDCPPSGFMLAPTTNGGGSFLP